jgi:hypothetical protein
MHTEAREHLVNLDKFEGYAAKEAYLAILVAAERAGYVSKPGAKGAIRHTNFSQGMRWSRKTGQGVKLFPI